MAIARHSCFGTAKHTPLPDAWTGPDPAVLAEARDCMQGMTLLTDETETNPKHFSRAVLAWPY